MRPSDSPGPGALLLSAAASQSGEGNVVGLAQTVCLPRPGKGNSKMDSRSKELLKDITADEGSWGLIRLR